MSSQGVVVVVAADHGIVAGFAHIVAETVWVLVQLGGIVPAGAAEAGQRFVVGES